MKMHYIIKYALKKTILIILLTKLIYQHNILAQVNNNIYKLIYIHSNSQSINMITKTITITGNVFIQYNSIQIYANKAIIDNFNKTHSKNIIQVYGNPITLYQIKNNKNYITAKSLQLSYEINNNIITFIGNVSFKKNHITICSNHIIYMINKKYIETSDNVNSPTSIIINNKIK